MRVSLVTPSTSFAISSPNSARTSSMSVAVSSTTSCSSAAASVCSSRWSCAQMRATPTGCSMKAEPARRAPRRRGRRPRRARESRLAREQRPEALRLEQMPTPEPRRLDLELGEDRGRLAVALVGRLAVFRDEPVAQLFEPRLGGEDPPHDELRRDSAVPAVLLEPERDVPTAVTPVAVELGPRAERDCRAGVEAVAPDAKAQMLPLAHRRELAELTTRGEQRHLGIAQAERRKTTELGAQVERQLRSARHDGVDPRHRLEVLLDEEARGVLRERLGERLDVLGLDREAGCCTMAAPALEERGAGPEPAV